MVNVIKRILASLYGLDRLITIPRLIFWIWMINFYVNTHIDPQYVPGRASGIFWILMIVLIFIEVYGSDFGGMDKVESLKDSSFFQKLLISLIATAFILTYVELWLGTFTDFVDYIFDKATELKEAKTTS